MFAPQGAFTRHVFTQIFYIRYFILVLSTKISETFNTKIMYKSFSQDFDTSVHIFLFLCVVFRDYLTLFCRRLERWTRIQSSIAEIILIYFNC